jgi:hypothetical protein
MIPFSWENGYVKNIVAESSLRLAHQTSKDLPGSASGPSCPVHGTLRVQVGLLPKLAPPPNRSTGALCRRVLFPADDALLRSASITKPHSCMVGEAGNLLDLGDKPQKGVDE